MYERGRAFELEVIVKQIQVVVRAGLEPGEYDALASSIYINMFIK